MEIQKFKQEEIQTLLSLRGAVINDVVYHVWSNNTNEQEEYQCLDWLELRFEDKSRLTFTAGEESDGIKIVIFDIIEERKKLLEQFQGKIDIKSFRVVKMDLWADVLNEKITEVKLTKIKEDFYPNDEMIIAFENDNQLKIGLSHEDGLSVDVFEDEPPVITSLDDYPEEDIDE
ncbi:hypothetical protein [Flammeovirga kamogawensis]|uniref:DUF2262 domain-containing protein n=1 Tax=Flammeovirga kamogawensis TaxID=373891 RepID=A0ABX8GY52_9BACT|nr:hypothetical protein [Flammeovirga kamogawensis]MBB6460881.1 hypothetical protein [Flammeovirga kamogawensis]QWG08226.1 hypothetical protein KM029_04625 [Flammeovirga kamogawensis]TRX70029.1 hypothetical protein EO216_18560 [Flammeovirga kamogawensis]